MQLLKVKPWSIVTIALQPHFALRWGKTQAHTVILVAPVGAQYGKRHAGG